MSLFIWGAAGEPFELTDLLNNDSYWTVTFPK